MCLKLTVFFFFSPVPVLVTTQQRMTEVGEGSSNGFTLVPATTTSLEITGLNGESSYDACVTAILGDVVGDSNSNECGTSNLSKSKPCNFH